MLTYSSTTPSEILTMAQLRLLHRTRLQKYCEKREIFAIRFCWLMCEKKNDMLNFRKKLWRQRIASSGKLWYIEGKRHRTKNDRICCCSSGYSRRFPSASCQAENPVKLHEITIFLLSLHKISLCNGPLQSRASPGAMDLFIECGV